MVRRSVERLCRVVVAAVSRVDRSGTVDFLRHATIGAPSFGCRISDDVAHRLPLSLSCPTRFRPFAAEELWASENPSTFPPSSYIAASKLSRVLVDGSKNSVASFFRHGTFQRTLSGCAMMSFAASIISSISSVAELHDVDQMFHRCHYPSIIRSFASCGMSLRLRIVQQPACTVTPDS